MKRSIHKKIYSELSSQFKLPVSVIEKICDSQFDFVKKIMMEGNDEPIRLQYLGVFKVKPGRRETVAKRIKRMKEIHYEKNRQKK